MVVDRNRNRDKLNSDYKTYKLTQKQTGELETEREREGIE